MKRVFALIATVAVCLLAVPLCGGHCVEMETACPMMGGGPVADPAVSSPPMAMECCADDRDEPVAVPAPVLAKLTLAGSELPPSPGVMGLAPPSPAPIAPPGHAMRASPAPPDLLSLHATLLI